MAQTTTPQVPARRAAGVQHGAQPTKTHHATGATAPGAQGHQRPATSTADLALGWAGLLVIVPLLALFVIRLGKAAMGHRTVVIARR